MSEFPKRREPRKPIKMGTYYDIVAGALYVFLAYFLYTNPPGSLNPEIIEIVMYVFAAYGVFRIGRGVYRFTKK